MYTKIESRNSFVTTGSQPQCLEAELTWSLHKLKLPRKEQCSKITVPSHDVDGLLHIGFSFRITGLYDVVVRVKKMPSRELLNLCGITLLKHASYGKQSFKNNSDLQCHTKVTLTVRPSVNDNGKFVFLILLDGGNASVWPQVWKLLFILFWGDARESQHYGGENEDQLTIKFLLSILTTDKTY